MKRITLVLFIISSVNFAQVNQNILKKIRSINSENDFNQTTISAAYIDSKIYEIITKQLAKPILNQDIETPFNHKKLDYLGYIHPNKTGIFKANPISAQKNNTAELDKKLYIFKYEDFYISTEKKDKQNLLNVYYTLRAINILKIRYKALYCQLFENSKTFATNKPIHANWVNANKAFWIAFNNNPKYVASNNTIFLRDGNFANSTVQKYSNVSLVNIDAENILGKSKTMGSRPIYKHKKDTENHLNYLKDGLIESIVHEMLHNYIDLAHSYNTYIHQIKANRGNSNFKYAEENAVLNASLHYFVKNGGLNKKLIRYYYTNTFNFNLATLKKTNQLNRYAKVFAKNVTHKNFKETFKMELPF